VGPELKFLGNLDMMHLMERSLRRAAIPYALSEGFNPHIKLSMGTVLPVGLWGENEYFDLELSQRMDIIDFRQKLSVALPSCLQLGECQEINDSAPSLMKIINAASYVFLLEPPFPSLDKWKEELLARPSLTVRSRGKKKGLDKELRTGIYRIEVEQSLNFGRVEIWVAVGEPVNVRYDELGELLLQTGFTQKSIAEVFRSGNYIREGSSYLSPLEVRLDKHTSPCGHSGVPPCGVTIKVGGMRVNK